jgi:DNA-binding CsgD family transcriptional regulator
MGETMQFSDRERQVIDHLLLGKSNKQIAGALGISVRAVEFHLSKIYSKLGVASRTEAALLLSELRLRESTGAVLRESAVLETDEVKDNVKASLSTRRIPMHKSFWIALSILIATSIFCVGSIVQMAKERGAAEEPIPIPTSISTQPIIPPTDIPTVAISPKEHILQQIRQRVAEYDQAVQAEKQNGDVVFSTDPTTGEDIFLFQGDSYIRIESLDEKLWEDINQLNALYVQIYRDELQPTPFPTQTSSVESKAYYDLLVSQTGAYCTATWDLEPKPESILVYRLDEGKYLPIGVGDDYARCELYGQMIEEWRTAPMMAKIDQDADMALIRQVMGKPDLTLTFQHISNIANAPWQNAALYTDETGIKYYVDIETARLAGIEPNLPGHPDISPAETKNIDELRGIAKQFASTNSPRLTELEAVLLYEENCKGSICFFRWDYRSKDWSGTDWAMMPPFLQVGVLTNGQIVTYVNSLDLFK